MNMPHYTIVRLNHVNAIENAYLATFDTEDQAVTEAMKKARKQRKRHMVRWHGVDVYGKSIVEAVRTLDGNAAFPDALEGEE